MTSTALNDFVFFGTDEFAVAVLDELKRLGRWPALIITNPDARRGRTLALTPPPVKLWAQANKIPCRQPENLRSDLGTSLRSDLENNASKLFLVASYGRVLPPELLALPERGVLNIHPSLLPKYRGPTPLQSAILNGDQETGVTIILIDEHIDHGPILLQAKSYKLKAKSYLEAREELARLGARMFFEVAPLWVAGKIKVVPQDHSQATYTKKIKKEDGEINLSQGDTLGDKGVTLYRKFLAYRGWPGTYFFTDWNGKKVRVIITAARLTNGRFVISRVKPDGRREMSWDDYQRGLKSSATD